MQHPLAGRRSVLKNPRHFPSRLAGRSGRRRHFHASPAADGFSSDDRHMPEFSRTLRGSTLAETLVMMLVAGIVFLSVMEGFRLFTRLQIRCAEALAENGRRRDGYFRLESVTAGADSIRPGAGGLEVYRRGRQSVLSLRDSALIYRTEEFRDTLLTRVAGLELSGTEPDTLEIALATGFTIRFPVKPPPEESYRRSLDEIETGYGYEE